MKHYDIAVLGGGPGGYVAAIKAAQLGAKTILIEEKNLGGVCLNEGCIPTKALLKSARVFEEVMSSEKYGIKITDKTAISVDWQAMQNRKTSVVSKLTGGVKSLLKQNGVEVISGRGEVLDKNTLKAGEELINTKNLIIATGSSPALPPIPGLQEALKAGFAVTSSEALAFSELPKEFIVAGGGVIGIEFAVLFNSLGCKVTVLEKFQMLGSLDKDIRLYMEKLLKEKGIKIFNNADIQSFEENKVIAKIEGKTECFTGDKILVSLGRVPNVKGLEKLGLNIDKKGIVTDERLRTNIPGIYAIGDVNGKQMLAHVASAEGITAVENIMGKNTTINYDKVPSCIYSFPEVGTVGLTEEEAVKRGHKVKTGTFPMTANGKALAEGEVEGFIKIVADAQYGEVLGVHIVASHATDMIAEIVTAMELEGTIYDLAKAIHPHPTLSEVVMEAAHGAIDMPIHVFKH
jgi:dihydrolipoamide dehydrogenase